jgi:hypothetical protein
LLRSKEGIPITFAKQNNFKILKGKQRQILKDKDLSPPLSPPARGGAAHLLLLKLRPPPCGETLEITAPSPLWGNFKNYASLPLVGRAGEGEFKCSSIL